MRALIGIAALGVALASTGSAFAQTKTGVGTIGAANASTIGAPGGALGIGSRVFNAQRIQTSGEGSAQIMFDDSSTMSLGRNSAIVIDRFVYDPASGGGQMAASLTRGVLRFVGGQISHGQGATVRTPVATIGVRGGTSMIALGGQCPLIASNQNGVITVTNNAGSQSITRPGYAVCVKGPNIPIGEPFAWDMGSIETNIRRLTSAKGQNGGASNPPGPDVFAREGIGTGRLPNDPGNTPGPGIANAIGGGDRLIKERQTQNQGSTVLLPLPNDPGRNIGVGPGPCAGPNCR